MHPTIDEQISGVHRLVETIAADDALSETSRDLVRHVLEILRLLESTRRQLLPFLATDNAALIELLLGIGRLLGVRAQVEEAATDGSASVDFQDESRLVERNMMLRASLADVIARLPETGPGNEGRRRIAQYLIKRSDRDPTLNPVHAKQSARRVLVTS